MPDPDLVNSRPLTTLIVFFRQQNPLCSHANPCIPCTAPQQSSMLLFTLQRLCLGTPSPSLTSGVHHLISGSPFAATTTSESKDQRQGHEPCLRFQRPGVRGLRRGFPPTGCCLVGGRRGERGRGGVGHQEVLH